MGKTVIKSVKQIENATRWLSIIAWGMLALAYTIIFRLFGESDIYPALQRALINVIPAALLTFPVLYIVQNFAIDRPLWRQTLIHILTASMFSVIWYIGIQTGYGLQKGWITEGISGRAFSGIALTWQFFQGLTLYAIAALFVYARCYRIRLAEARLEVSDLKSQLSQQNVTQNSILVKDGKQLKTVSIQDIFALSGAGDYTEVSTREGRYLSNTSLSDFQFRLPKNDFLRVHRSHIVRTDAVLSFENAGNGRLSLHLPNGLSIITSRSGRRALLERAL